MNERFVMWCKREDGTIIEHVTDLYSGHRGHVRCVPIEPVPVEGEDQ